MNWLAHLYLAESDAAFRVGSLLPDLARPAILAVLSEGFQRGIRQHRAVDRFTDTHPIVRRSIARMEPQFRRFGGIAVDLFYDHFLSCEWERFHPASVREFVDAFFAEAQGMRDALTDEIAERLDDVRSGDWLCSYASLEGVAAALARMERRMKRPVALRSAVRALESDYAGFQEDFRAFFPLLQEYARSVEPLPR